MINEEYTGPGGFEHRVDPESEKLIYNYVREFKPKNTLEIGTSRGGSTIAILSALLKNEKPFTYVASELLDDLKTECASHCKETCGVEPIMIGDITQNLDKVPEKIDFLMHDDDHDLPTAQWVLDNIFPRLTKGALVIFHDWAVEDKNGKWVQKSGAWPETNLMIKLHEEEKLPLKKVYFSFVGQGSPELGIFTYETPD